MTLSYTGNGMMDSRTAAMIKIGLQSVRFGFGILLGVVVFASAGPGVSAELPARLDPVADYYVQWLEVTSAIGDISKSTLALDADQPDPAVVKRLADAANRLEDAGSTLMRAVPPEDNARMHVIALPRVLEIVGAARELLHVIDGKDAAETAASLEWLDNALMQLQKAVRAAARPAEKSGAGEN